MTPVDIKQAQEKDPSISVILEKKRANQSFSADEKKTLSVASRRLLSEWKRLSLIDGILYRKSGVYEQLVVPSGLRRLVYTQLHDEMGHLGIDRVLSLARERFHWPHMKADLEHYVTKACRCLKQKPPSKKTRAPMQSITTTAPLELVYIDFMHLERSSGGYEYILVIVDHFTRYSQAYATRNKLARTVESKLYDDFILRFGYPAKIHHDQGKELRTIFSGICKYCATFLTPVLHRITHRGMGKLKDITTPYCQCFESSQSPRNQSGKISSIRSFTHIIAHSMRQLATTHSF